MSFPGRPPPDDAVAASLDGWTARVARSGRSTLSGADIIGVSACRDERTLNGHARDLCADQSVTLEKVIGSRLEVHALGDW